MPSLILKLTTVAACCASLVGLNSTEYFSDSERMPQSATPPGLEADPVNTQRLIGKRYYGESPWGEMVLSFADKTLSASWQSWETDALDQREVGYANGKWTVDADGQLLMQFGAEHWLLFHIEQGVGEGQMFAYQHANLGHTYFSFFTVEQGQHPLFFDSADQESQPVYALGCLTPNTSTGCRLPFSST